MSSLEERERVLVLIGAEFPEIDRGALEEAYALIDPAMRHLCEPMDALCYRPEAREEKPCPSSLKKS